MIQQGTGNLLDADTEALVNAVNCVGVMGAGIAKQFKRRWPVMFRDYRAACAAGSVVPGVVHVWRTGELTHPQFILNVPTKRHWRARSKLEDVATGVTALAHTLEQLGIHSVAIPALGAGHGGLDWRQVRPLIVRALRPLADVQVQLWEPGFVPASTIT